MLSPFILSGTKKNVPAKDHANTLLYYGDAEDIHFWESIDLSQIQLVLLALPSVVDAMTITTQLNAAQYQGKIAAIARYDDERLQLEEFGAPITRMSSAILHSSLTVSCRLVVA